MNTESDNSCIICLDNEDKEIKIFPFTYKDKIKKINCECNVYCHTSCINQNIFEYNQGRQDCIVCNKEYDPNYENNNFEIIFENRNHLKKIIRVFNYFLTFLRYILMLLMIISIIYAYYNYRTN